MSNTAPEYAPPARHLLSATVLGIPPLDDDELFARALADLRVMFCGDRRAQVALATYRPLRLYRLPFAQFAQPPGIHASLPSNESGRPGLYFAAEWTEASSLNAAMVSGEKCAEVLLRRG
jgi:phytoene dehydrogenase-like protein